MNRVAYSNTQCMTALRLLAFARKSSGHGIQEDAPHDCPLKPRRAHEVVHPLAERREQVQVDHREEVVPLVKVPIVNTLGNRENPLFFIDFP